MRYSEMIAREKHTARRRGGSRRETGHGLPHPIWVFLIAPVLIGIFVLWS